MATMDASAKPRRAPLTIIRVETVLTRFPIHTLSKTGGGTIHIRKQSPQGTLDTRWEVSYNARYGPPRQLAYKLDTLVINQKLDALGRPLPTIIKLGSFAHICRLLGVDDGGGTKAAIKKAFFQNIGAHIVATLRYQSSDGRIQTLDAAFHRYSVVFTGEHLPTGAKADAVYLVLDELYRRVLNHVPVRPLDYNYLKDLPPMPQRFYELVSFKLFAALKHSRPTAKLGYVEYCLFAPQQRYTNASQMQKQMYKVHQPHIQSGYLTKVYYQATTDAEGLPDWLLHYTPGPKAKAEYAPFMRQPGAEAAALTLPMDADQDDLLATMTHAPPAAPPPAAVASMPPIAGRTAREAPTRPAPLPDATPTRPQTAAPAARSTPPADPLQAQAVALVQQFYQRFYGFAQVTPSPTELAHATALLTQHGAAKAHFLLAFAHQAAPETHYEPQTFGGIRHYLPRALAAYDAQAAQATQVAAQRAAADERTQREQYQTWEQHEVDQRRAALPPAALAAREAAARARLVAAGTPAVALPLAVRVAIDRVLAEQAELPSFEAWRQTQEGGR